MSATESQLHLRFLLNPIAFESDDGTNISRVVCERTRLSGQAGNQIAKGTGETETLKAQLVRNHQDMIVQTKKKVCFLSMKLNVFVFVAVCILRLRVLPGTYKYWL